MEAAFPTAVELGFIVARELNDGGLSPPYMPLFRAQGTLLRRCKPANTTLQSLVESTWVCAHPMVEHL